MGWEILRGKDSKDAFMMIHDPNRNLTRKQTEKLWEYWRKVNKKTTPQDAEWWNS